LKLQGLLFAILPLGLLPGTGRADDLAAVTPRGAAVSVVADFPIAKGPFPAIVLAPGQGYHMGLPVLEETARAIVANGVAVFRFNWAYFTAKPRRGEPTENLSRELEDLQAVVVLARRHPRVISANVSVGGKSLGSIVAWNALLADPTLRSALLLTPICSRVAKGEATANSEADENYPRFKTETRPTLWVSGNRDPLCYPPVLYSFAGTGTGSARIAIVGGDHGYEFPSLSPPVRPAASARTIKAVAALAASFISEISEQGPSAP